MSDELLLCSINYYHNFKLFRCYFLSKTKGFPKNNEIQSTGKPCLRHGDCGSAGMRCQKSPDGNYSLLEKYPDFGYSPDLGKLPDEDFSDLGKYPDEDYSHLGECVCKNNYFGPFCQFSKFFYLRSKLCKSLVYLE